MKNKTVRGVIVRSQITHTVDVGEGLLVDVTEEDSVQFKDQTVDIFCTGIFGKHVQGFEGFVLVKPKTLSEELVDKAFDVPARNGTAAMILHQAQGDSWPYTSREAKAPPRDRSTPTPGYEKDAELQKAKMAKLSPEDKSKPRYERPWRP